MTKDRLFYGDSPQVAAQKVLRDSLAIAWHYSTQCEYPAMRDAIQEFVTAEGKNLQTFTERLNDIAGEIGKKGFGGGDE